MPRLGVYAPDRGIRTHDPLITSREHEPLCHSIQSREGKRGRSGTNTLKIAKRDHTLFHKDATGSIPNLLKTSCEGAKRPRGGGCVPPPMVWSFFVFQCWIVCAGAYFRGYFHIFLHIISVFNLVLGTYCHMVIKKKKKYIYIYMYFFYYLFWKFLEIRKFPEMWHLRWSLLNSFFLGSN